MSGEGPAARIHNEQTRHRADSEVWASGELYVSAGLYSGEKNVNKFRLWKLEVEVEEMFSPYLLTLKASESEKGEFKTYSASVKVLKIIICVIFYTNLRPKSEGAE